MVIDRQTHRSNDYHNPSVSDQFFDHGSHIIIIIIITLALAIYHTSCIQLINSYVSSANTVKLCSWNCPLFKRLTNLYTVQDTTCTCKFAKTAYNSTVPIIIVGWSNFNTCTCTAKAHRPCQYTYLGIQFSLRLCPDWIRWILDKAHAVHLD